jgi:hypothetical protein
MHRLWDADMIGRAGDTEELWLDELAALDTAENRAAWTCGAVEDWATESLLAARAAYLIPGSDMRLKPGQKLGEAKIASYRSVVPTVWLLVVVELLVNHRHSRKIPTS